MAGLCKVGNELPGSLKAVSNEASTLDQGRHGRDWPRGPAWYGTGAAVGHREISPAHEVPRPTSRLLASRPNPEAEVDDHPTRMEVSYD
ncbi:hypothetical protein ANN_13363 [Periplaneta americana]|uniref:Uncharacterized protein n=1 Tax=Periplaneta americana TaxID=6978 RepID=A0ABQ8TJ68_PERAM|nr:hypothetical protein ANN_13363 [Periplaneta americana]